MLNLLNRQKVELAGLDIGHSAVKLVRLEKGEEGYTLMAAASESVAPCPSDEKKQRQSRVDAIRACLQKTGLKNGNVVCGVAGPEVVVRGFTFPPLPDAAVAQAVQMEAQQVCPLDMKNSVLDFQLIETLPALAEEASKTPARQGVMTVATENTVREQTELLTAAGARALMVDVNALALLNCVNALDLSNAQETLAVIDIGEVQTNVIIYGTDGLPFVRDINIAGAQIIQEICRTTKLPEDEIRKMLQAERSSEQLDGNVLLAMNNAIGPLMNAVNETLRFYSFQEKTTGVDRILLCGGFALIDAIVEFLTDAVSMPIVLFNPFSSMRYDAGFGGHETLEKDGPAFAVAAGLAMRTL